MTQPQLGPKCLNDGWVLEVVFDAGVQLRHGDGRSSLLVGRDRDAFIHALELEGPCLLNRPLLDIHIEVES